MQFNNPIPRGRQPFRHESSPLRSPLDSDDVTKSWAKSKHGETQLYALAHNVALLQRSLERLRRRVGGGSEGSGATWLP